MPLSEGKRLSQAGLNPEELDTELLNPSNLPFSFHSLPSPHWRRRILALSRWLFTGLILLSRW